MVLVHFGDAPASAQEADVGRSLHHSALPADHIDMVRWHCHPSSNQDVALHVLLPEFWKDRELLSPSHLGNAPVIWYTEDFSFSLPESSDDSDVWIVNGNRTPTIEWDAARLAARRRACDVLVFSAGELATDGRYSESVQVDKTGRVLRFRRHYPDSPMFEGPLPGGASFLVCCAGHAPAVAAHLAAHGWGLDSIGGLTRRFHVRWSDVSPRGQSAGVLTPEGLACDAWSYRFAKRSMDIAFSATALVFLLPFLLVVAALVKLTSRGPALFGHKRQGLGGKEFRCLKFRTMIEGADAMQARLRTNNEVDGPQFKITKDPRLTRLGRGLQQYNIDEIPQLINVLRGEMSLVGPRPSPDQENQFCPGWRKARLSVRPGITGLWQVLRRREHTDSDFQEWIFYDLEYIRHRSLWLDWQILLHTPYSMFAFSRLGRFVRKLERHGICIHSAWIAPNDSSPPHSEADSDEDGMDAA